MAAPRSGSDNSNTMLYVVVIFIILFLTAAVFAVVMYMQNETLVKERNDAEEELADFGNSRELREVKSMAIKKGSRVTTTVLGRLSADMRVLCELIGGSDLSDFSLTGAKLRAEERLEPIWEMLPDVMMYPEGADRKNGLAKIMQSIIAETGTLIDGYNSSIKEKDQQISNYKQQLAQRDTQIGLLKAEVAKYSSASKNIETNSNKLIVGQSDRYESIISDRDAEISKLESEKDQMKKDSDALLEKVAQYDKELKELKKILQQVRPSPDMEVEALDTDGYVVSVASNEDMVYINLSDKDHIYRGLTFSVYDSFQEIPKDGKGKGTIEVIEITDKISKCRITESDQSNPIMKNDVIANLIWDKVKKYKFCVVGDFDFDGDGKTDIDGRKQVVDLIKNWGGQADEKLTVDTDFLVLGYRPSLSAGAPNELSEQNKTAADSQQAGAKAILYDQVRQGGAALGVPTFNMKRFLRFIGYYQKPK